MAPTFRRGLLVDFSPYELMVLAVAKLGGLINRWNINQTSS